MEHHEMTRDEIFSYNLLKKRYFVFISMFIAAVLITFIIIYLLVLKDSGFFVIEIINGFIGGIIFHIKNATTLGALYATLFGGLFFVFLPLEAVFVAFLRGGNNPLLIISLYLLGLFLSYTANYFIGMKLSDLSKKIITQKKFYKIKSVINKYGGWAVFGFNVFPLPAQPLSAILGVFKYNLPRFYTLFLLGQAIKYSVIAIGYFYII